MIQTILYRIQRNPVLVGAAALWAIDTLSTGDPLTWRTLLYTVTGFIVRSKVVPLNEVVMEDLADVIARAMKDAEPEPQA